MALWPEDAKIRANIGFGLFLIGGLVLTGASSWGFLQALGTLGQPGIVLFSLGTVKVSIALILGLLQLYFALVVYKMKGL